MTIRYVWSGAGGGNKTGVSWTHAYTTLASAVMNAGDVIFVSHQHNEATSQSGPIVSNGNSQFPVWVYCVLTLPPPTLPTFADLRTTARVQTFFDESISFSGTASYYGITFIAGRLSGNPTLSLAMGSAQWNRFENCSLQIGSTGATAKIASSGGYGSCIELINTTLGFQNVNQSFVHGSLVKWRNTPNALVGTIPNTLFIPAPGGAPELECVGVDLSAAGSGKTLVGADPQSTNSRYSFTDCKLNSAVTRSATPLSHGGMRADFLRSGSAPSNYTLNSYRKAAVLTEETITTRNGGGVVSWKVITAPSCNYSTPFECPPIAFWVDTVGAPVTATLEVLSALATAKDNEIWLDVEYLGSASSPLGSFVNDGTPDLLATPADQTTSAVTWSGAGTKFKLNVSFTPQQKGWAYARVKIGKPSTTFYIDPIVTLS